MGADNQQNNSGNNSKNQHSKSSLVSFQQSVTRNNFGITSYHWKGTGTNPTTADDTIDDCSVATGTSSLSWSSPYYSPMKISYSGSNPSSPNSTISTLPVATVATCTAAVGSTTFTAIAPKKEFLSTTTTNDVNVLHPSNILPLNVPEIENGPGARVCNSIAYPLYHSVCIPTLYQPINLTYPGLTMIHGNPPVFVVHDFLSSQECYHLVQLAYNMDGSSSSTGFGPAPVVGSNNSSSPSSTRAGAGTMAVGEVSSMRTSTTCCLSPLEVPFLLQKIASIFPTKPLEHMESPQIGRYERGQQYLQHYDAFDLTTEAGQAHAANGGQRVVTVLTYLNTVPPPGGSTYFPLLNHLRIQPCQGMALIFFPATIYGQLDPMALHAAEPALNTTKYVSQIWIRQGPHQSVTLPNSPALNYNSAANRINVLTSWPQSHIS